MSGRINQYGTQSLFFKNESPLLSSHSASENIEMLDASSLIAVGDLSEQVAKKLLIQSRENSCPTTPNGRKSMSTDCSPIKDPPRREGAASRAPIASQTKLNFSTPPLKPSSHSSAYSPEKDFSSSMDTSRLEVSGKSMWASSPNSSPMKDSSSRLNAMAGAGSLSSRNSLLFSSSSLTQSSNSLSSDSELPFPLVAQASKVSRESSRHSTPKFSPMVSSGPGSPMRDASFFASSSSSSRPLSSKARLLLSSSFKSLHKEDSSQKNFPFSSSAMSQQQGSRESSLPSTPQYGPASMHMDMADLGQSSLENAGLSQWSSSSSSSSLPAKSSSFSSGEEHQPMEMTLSHKRSLLHGEEEAGQQGPSQSPTILSLLTSSFSGAGNQSEPSFARRRNSISSLFHLNGIAKRDKRRGSVSDIFEKRKEIIAAQEKMASAAHSNTRSLFMEPIYRMNGSASSFHKACLQAMSSSVSSAPGEFPQANPKDQMECDEIEGVNSSDEEEGFSVKSSSGQAWSSSSSASAFANSSSNNLIQLESEKSSRAKKPQYFDRPQKVMHSASSSSSSSSSSASQAAALQTHIKRRAEDADLVIEESDKPLAKKLKAEPPKQFSLSS